ncbi:MAG: ribonuclease Z [Dysgonamonadaceae bacterium]|nr:ribonuclease Z [Dysgonamonadaceae bacterium]MDD3356298.1 ribonuclease Z [Dysgonamonadaceae bacterium]MDD3727839.1 ribonuclease Z [Dysgonamonadaceae bacterium]
MTNFKVQILGCGSALPTTIHMLSSQLVEMNGKLFMIDCGEGTQLQMRKFGARMSKLHSIFISHLHGDHVFGLPGLISTLGLLGRTAELTIYAHQELEQFINPVLNFFCKDLSYNVRLVLLRRKGYNLIYETRSISVFSFPLKHRIATSGFLFKEKEKLRHIKREMIDYYNIPFREINNIKSGADFVTPKGEVVPNEQLTTPPTPPRSYAYCSDTAYDESIVPYIKKVDVLYHEGTFTESEMERATKTAHSTARQAAEIARLAEVKKLVIGHFSSRYKELDTLLNEAQEVFPNTELAFEGKVIEL